MASWKESLQTILQDENENDQPPASNVVNQTFIKGMQDGEITLAAFVEELGFHLMTSDVSKRVQATTLLSTVISGLPRDFFNEAEVCHLLEYYFARLLDHHNLIPSILKGLTALTKCAQFPPSQAYPVFNQVTLNTNIPTLLSQERYDVYSLVAYLLRHFISNLKENDAAFVQGYIQMMDGERDPRCLVLLFSITPIVLKEFPIGLYIQDFFEILSCYFPVDFTPLPNDSFGITREILAKGLETCLMGNEKFSPLTLPLILEKIESNLEIAKIDSLNLLISSFKAYPPSSFENHLSDIWPHLRTEIFLGHSKVIQELSLECIGLLVSTAHQIYCSNTLVYCKTQADKERFLPLRVLLLDIWQDCKQFIAGTEIKHLRASLNVMKKLLKSSNIGAYYFEEDLFHLILESYNLKNQVPLKEVFLEYASELLAVTTDGLPNGRVPEYGYSIKTFFSAILETEKNPRLLIAALKGAHHVFSLEAFSDDPYWEITLASDFSYLIETDDEALRLTLIEVLIKVDAQNHALAEHFVFSELLGKLKALISEESIANANPLPEHNDQDNCDYDDSQEPFVPASEENIPKYFSILTALKHHPEKIVPFVLEFILKTCYDEPTGAEHAASCLLDLASIPSPSLSDCLVPLISICANAKKVLAPSLLQKCYRILEVALRHQNSEIMHPILEDLVLLILHQDPTTLHVLQVDSVSLHSLLPLLQVILANLSLNIEIPQRKQLMAKLIETTTTWSAEQEKGDNDTLVHPMCHCASLLLNKAPEPEAQDLASATLFKLNSYADKASPSGVLLWIWLAKALAIRNHALADQFVHKMIEWLESPELGNQAAEGFAIMLKDHPEIFVPDFSNTRMLYRQKFFVQTSARLLDGYYSCCNDAVKSNFLLALTHELRYAPQAAVLQDIEKFLPVLLQAFDTRPHLQCNPQLQCSLLNTIKNILSHSPRLLEDHLHTLTPRLLALLSTSLPLKVRRLALQCILQLCSSLKPHLLLPLRSQVVRQLTKMLNDPKRVVRKEAVHARNSWILVGQPSS